MKEPEYRKLKTFECKALPNLQPYQKNKLEAKSSPHIYLGYPGKQMATFAMNPLPDAP